MSKQVQKIWAELSKNKRKGTNLGLTKRNVKLSIVDDLERLYNEVESAQMDQSYFTYEIIDEQEEKLSDIMIIIDEMIINSQMMYAKDGADEMAELLAKVEESAKGLGLDPQDVFDQYDDAKELVDAVNSTHDDLVDNWRSSRLQNITAFADRIKR